jgi:hypothetical protein
MAEAVELVPQGIYFGGFISLMPLDYHIDLIDVIVR